MGLLDSIHRGKNSVPPIVLVYGTNGIGKSTFAAGAPSPIFVSTEGGLGEIDCASFPQCRSFRDVESALGCLLSDAHDYKTVVLDSADWLDILICDAMRAEYGVSSVEDIKGGFGKWQGESLQWWRRVLDGLSALRARGMCVVVTAHAKVEKFDDPDGASYDRYSPRLHKAANALVCEWADAVLFASYKKRMVKEQKGFNKTRAIAEPIRTADGDIERVLRAVGGPACIAKNRYGLPAEIPLSWGSFVSSIGASKRG